MHDVIRRYADKKSIEIARQHLEGMRGRIPALHRTVVDVLATLKAERVVVDYEI